ncbi:MAG: T9SS type A sorting domain-containing protein [Hyphomicrobiales bacterium]
MNIRKYLGFICIIFLSKVAFSSSIVNNYIPQDTTSIMPPSYQLGGTVYNDEGRTIKKGKALLYKKKDYISSSNAQKYTPLDTVNIRSEYSFYLFDRLSEGEYLVKIIPDIEEYRDCIPKYYKNVFYDRATTIHLNNNSIDNDFHLHTPSYDIFSGSGVIHGNVTFNIIENSREGNQPINKNGIVILIINRDSREIVGYTLTDENGYFRLNNISNGKYILLAENTDWIFWPSNVEISDHTSTAETQLVLFQIRGETAVHNMETNIPKVYPNPCTDYIIIDSDISSRNGIKTDYSIFDLKGCKIKSNLTVTVNNSKKQINVNDLNKGVYILKIQTKESVANIKFVKK